jgi:ADP-heptose:LPS heptosyltransferase
MSAARLHTFDHVIGLCPGAKHFTKRWQREKYAELGIRFARERKAKILLFGGPAEREDCQYVARTIAAACGADAVTDHSGTLRLMETAAAFDYCDVVVTNDSGLMHIAAARQRKVVAMFGSTVREFGFGPFGTEAIVLERTGLTCRPCTHIGRASCPLGHLRCLNDIGVDEASAAVTKLL